MTNSERTLTITHGGKTFTGHLATIKSTTLGWEDHGILSAMLMCEWPSSGIGVGGYCLDTPKDRDSGDYSRLGTAFGLDHIMRIMETVGVSRWESLPGKHVVVLFEGAQASTWGMSSVGIAHATEDKVLIFKEHAAEWLEKEPATA